MSTQTREQIGEQTVFARQAQECLDDSKRWFPAVSKSITHLTLGMAGEVGEFANIIKKIERGDFSINEATTRIRLREELTDVYIYLLNIAGLLNIDLSKSYVTTRAINEKRFGHHD
jgi:NTP pyrophosphatase (non-canonical NTP hydrolase)